jgi:signal peptidase I
VNFLQNVRVNGESMAPTLRSGQRALFIRINRADRRLIGKVVLVARLNSFGARDFFQIKRVTDYQDGKFFITGDNKEFSTDSREFGWITGAEILGRLLAKFKS